MQPLSGFLNSTDLKRAQALLAVKPPLLSQQQFDVMKKLIQMDIPQFEFTWASLIYFFDLGYVNNPPP